MIDKAFRICSTDGKEQTRIGLISKLSYGGNRVVYHRQDLHDVLKEAATSSTSQAPGAKIRVSSRVTSANCLEGSVTLENGEVLEGFDVVIGADGIRSMIRGSVLGKEVNAVPTGVSAYRMIISAKSIEDDEQISRFLDPRDSCTTMVVGHDCRLIMGPARNGEIYSIVAMVPDGKHIFHSYKGSADRSMQRKHMRIPMQHLGQQKVTWTVFLEVSRNFQIGARGFSSMHLNWGYGN
jgi:salicylate hydroxylase